MKNKIALGLLLTTLCLAVLGITACGSGSQDGLSRQTAMVEKGDIEISVTGSGTIEATRESRLTFGSAGKVDKILVKEGVEVKQDDVLAMLDTRPLELALTQAQVTLAQAEVANTQARLAHHTAEYNLKKIRDTEDTLKIAVLNTQIALDQAQKLLDTGIVATDYQAAKAELNRAKAWLEYIQKEGADPTEDIYGRTALERAEEQVKIAQANYDNVLSGYDSQDIATKKKQVEAAEIAVAQAQENLNDLVEDVTIQEMQVEAANQSVLQADQSVELARQSLAEAQRQLDEATIMAPFDGVVASVMVKEGDNIPSPSMVPTTIVHLVDPGYMELVVEIDEIDIPLLKLDQEAMITIDALPDSEFKGYVTAVYPMPMEVAGVVLYDVRLSLEVPENSGIKIGMSASADVVIEKHTDVLIVPSRAVKDDDSGQTVVNVMLSGEELEERPVVIGIDDGFQTEITSGLQEGETIMFEVKVKTPSTSMF
jgi:HlyD family secretion protein